MTGLRTGLILGNRADMEKFARRSEFDDLRPYYDEEVEAALSRVASDPMFPLVAAYLYPGTPLEEIRLKLRSLSTVDDFQRSIMMDAFEKIISETTDGLSGGGMDLIDNDRACLFVSNHRDIMLDAAFLEYLLISGGHPTTEITFGANLMMNGFIVDIGKCNRMFKVERPGTNVREFYTSSAHLSDYIRYTLTEKSSSVWIAQRNGRTKNGDDATDQGIVKMFGMSRPGDKVNAIDELHIVPVAVSYEWEPCAVLKAREVLKSASGAYVKKPGEDLNSVITGVLRKKGRVHIEICEPLKREELERYGHLKSTEYHKAVARLIDGRIIPAYRLFPNNYIAYDLIHGDGRFSDRYDEAQAAEFMKEFEEVRTSGCDELVRIYLGIYANPVENKMKWADSL